MSGAQGRRRVAAASALPGPAPRFLRPLLLGGLDPGLSGPGQPCRGLRLRGRFRPLSPDPRPARLEHQLGALGRNRGGHAAQCERAPPDAGLPGHRAAAGAEDLRRAAGAGADPNRRDLGRLAALLRLPPPDRSRSEFFSDLEPPARSRRPPEPPSAPPKPALLRRLNEAPPNSRRKLLLEFVRSQAVKLLGSIRRSRSTTGNRFSDLGLDSLMAVELKAS